MSVEGDVVYADGRTWQRDGSRKTNKTSKNWWYSPPTPTRRWSEACALSELKKFDDFAWLVRNTVPQPDVDNKLQFEWEVAHMDIAPAHVEPLEPELLATPDALRPNHAGQATTGGSDSAQVDADTILALLDAQIRHWEQLEHHNAANNFLENAYLCAVRAETLTDFRADVLACTSQSYDGRMPASLRQKVRKKVAENRQHGSDS